MLNIVEPLAEQTEAEALLLMHGNFFKPAVCSSDFWDVAASLLVISKHWQTVC